MNKLDFLLLKFTEYLKVSGYSERTVPGYEQNIKYYLDYLKELGIENISEADRKVVTDYQTRVYLQSYKGKPLAVGTQQIRLTCIHTFYRYLLKAGLITYDPSVNIELSKSQEHLPKALTKREIGKLLSIPNLETIRGIRDRAILEVLYSPGSESQNFAISR